MNLPFDAWLWELRPGPDDGPAPPDAELHAYRRGSLSTADAERLEWMLARSAAGRARLATLAGVFPAAVPARLRRRLFPDAGAHPAFLDWRWAAAALAVAACVIAFLSLPRAPLGPVALPEFDVHVLGRAETRSAPDTTRALPDGPVPIEA